ncbi:hypothetical protein KXQ82_03095 [Mucilaginibacter sp. HMF5004]|uniref:hypothetical protein n=1 Tax=Mucilaginibacter rivuli TaxID=2857527 RepID=UPI001C5E740B|nr:hypothetical protein [Mucilaginibacter rivuli]MBW4888679.1 hypothetical protein [Mucilaginibacter rivuli]
MNTHKLLIPLVVGCGLCLAQITATAQEFKTHISKQFTLQQTASASVLAIYNVFGSIRVEGYNGNEVIIEIDETIKSDNEGDLAAGKRDFKMGFSQSKDSVIAYVAAPYDSRPHINWRNNEDNRHINYTVKLDYVVKVPNNINLRVSTINNGTIDVKDVYGKLKVNNINGGITIANAKGVSDIHTVNGPVTVNYLAIPTDTCKYYTINGKMEITFPKNLSADMQFKSMNGKFYTDFDEVEALPTQVTKTQDKKANGTTYKLNKNTQVRVGAGGKLFKFETLNGNIYIKKQS